MQTANPSGLESLLLQQVKDKAPIVHHFPGDEMDENLTHEEIKVELYKDGYAIYFVVPRRRNRLISYMAFISFDSGKMRMHIQLKPWQYSKKPFIYLIFIFLASLIFDFVTQSLDTTIILTIAVTINLLILRAEKRVFCQRIDYYLANLH